jgi:hypothetical protein
MGFHEKFWYYLGVTLPYVIFSNRFNHFSGQISDPAGRTLFSNGHTYGHGTKLFIESSWGD